MLEEIPSTGRQLPRFPFIAEADLAQPDGGIALKVRISELSARGCYVDTINPIPVDTEIRLTIRFSGGACELPGKILYSHAGYGLGVLFGEVAVDQRAILEAWIAQIAAHPGG